MINDIIKKLEDNLSLHNINCKQYRLLDKQLKNYIEKNFIKYIDIKINNRNINLYNEIQGNYESKYLLTLHELCLFSIYSLNRNNYVRFYDLGANIGLHSLVANAYGYKVECYEPDPKTFSILNKNTQFEKSINTHNKAISLNISNKSFTRVLDNHTASGFSDMKDFYGITEELEVKCESYSNLKIENAIVKVDIEGSEKEFIKYITNKKYSNSLFLLEITNISSAKFLWDNKNLIQGDILSQKSGWNKIKKIEDIPSNWREGSVAICTKIS